MILGAKVDVGTGIRIVGVDPEGESVCNPLDKTATQSQCLFLLTIMLFLFDVVIIPGRWGTGGAMWSPLGLMVPRLLLEPLVW